VATVVRHRRKTIHLTEKEAIEKVKKQDPTAQRWLYDRYAPLFLAVCRRYVSNLQDAEDIMIEGFYKIFTRLDQYNGKGSFEGWMRRVMVNEALMYLRKKHALTMSVEFDNRLHGSAAQENIVDAMAADDILKLLDQLPTGYRTVFNLYVLEGFKHREIADILDISINTSKSQLIQAKKRLREALIAQNYPGTP
jgi:RNA polymerase sigma factor (sigma-70 family)